MAFSSQIAPAERFALRGSSKPLIRPSGTFSRKGRRGAGVSGHILKANYTHSVIPAKAGTPVFLKSRQTEIPAFAGMTRWGTMN